MFLEYKLILMKFLYDFYKIIGLHVLLLISFVVHLAYFIYF
jgi:hypothetical protein